MKHMSVGLLAVLVAVSLLKADNDESSSEPCGSEQYLLIQGIIPGSAAEAQGVEAGDIIVSYDGTPVHCLDKLTMAKEAVKTETVAMVVKRGEEILTFTIPEGVIGVYVMEMLPDIDFSAEKDAVVIDGIGPLAWSSGETNSFFGALARITEHLNLDQNYTHLMGASGAAFRLHFHKDWCPSSPDPTVGYDCGAVAARCVNLAPTYIHANKDTTNVDEMMQAIVQSIDRNMPVIAIDLMQIPEWGIVVGYQNAGEKLIVRDYYDHREGYDIAEKFPWAIVTLAREEGEIDDIKNLKQAFTRAQELYETEMYGDYYSGITALEYWMQQLRTDDFAAYDDEKLEEVIRANAWIYDRYADDRMFGARYLKINSGKMPAVAEEIEKLAALYESEHALLTSENNIAPYPEYFTTMKSWNDEMRAREIEILGQVLAHEKDALSVIKKINMKLAH